MSSEKVRVAVIGVGGMGYTHARMSSELEEFELVALADINPDRAREMGEEWECPHYTSHEELLENEELDAVTIATPHYFHPPIAIDGFAAGLHVLSEKPIGVRVGEAEKMGEAARKAGKLFAVMFQARTRPEIRKARELIENGELGELKRSLLVAPCFRSQAYYDSGTWRATWAGEGGGVMMNQAPHSMDLFTLLGGMPSRVRGRCATLMHEIEVEDHAEGMLEYENGACGYVYMSTCEAGPTVLEFVGDKGRLRIEGGELSFWRYSPAVSEFNRENTEMWGRPDIEQVELELPECESGHRELMRNFGRAILDGEPLVAPGEEGLKSLELANAITLSAHKGEPVDFPISRTEFSDLIDYLRSTSSFEEDWAATKAESDPNI